MKLYITRDQAKGTFGGMKFILKAKVELTDEERNLIKKYKADKEILFQSEAKILGKPISFNIAIGSLVAGENFKCKDIAEILETEKIVKESCEMFKNYIEAMKNFGGQEVAEY